jgi:excinuclease UvrABC nuclease subunit
MNVGDVCNSPGVYIILNRNQEVQYVGHSSDLSSRLSAHLNRKDLSDARYFKTYRTRSTQGAQTLERQLIKQLKPRLNVREP